MPKGARKPRAEKTNAGKAFSFAQELEKRCQVSRVCPKFS